MPVWCWIMIVERSAEINLVSLQYRHYSKKKGGETLAKNSGAATISIQNKLKIAS